MDQIKKLSYLAVDGPIGAGKSSLAKMLAKNYKAQAVLEAPDENPFLDSFYKDPSRHAMQTQLFFLLSRYQQQLELKQKDLFSSLVVCDYLFSKDYVFAQLNLTEEEFGLYSKIYHLLDQNLPKPDAVIYLQATPDVLLKHVRMRNKAYEKKIDRDYLVQVSEVYSQFFFQYNDAPVLVVNSTGMDFVNHARDYEMLKKELAHLLQSGQDKHYVTIRPR